MEIMDSLVQNTYRIHVRLGDAEFEAHGPEEIVRQQFDAFLETVRSGAVVGSCNGKSSVREERRPPAEESIPLGASQRALLDRAFLVSDDEVSLRVLPSSEDSRRDTLLLLLYGYKVLKSEEAVSSGQLARSVRQSGISVDRVDRYVAPQFVNRGGRNRGTRYSLNNRGIMRAEELLEGLFE